MWPFLCPQTLGSFNLDEDLPKSDPDTFLLGRKDPPWTLCFEGNTNIMPIIPLLLGLAYKSVHSFIQQIFIQSLLWPHSSGEAVMIKQSQTTVLMERTLPGMQTDDEQLGRV